MIYPFWIQPYLDWSFWNNSAQAWLDALLIFTGIILLAAALRLFILRALEAWAKRTKTSFDDAVVAGVSEVRFPFYIILGLFFAVRSLEAHYWFDTLAWAMLAAGLLYYAAKMVNAGIDWVADRRASSESTVDGSGAVHVIARVAKVSVWFLAFLLWLQNLGIEITPLIAGLGVGGIAIAFALQNVLQDIFSSFSIYFDKPFQVGDFIIVGSDMGVVKYIGMKTTRLQTLQGQELVISNRELTSTRINNYKRMDERRIQFGFGVEYGTPSDKLRLVNDVVKTAVEGAGARLDRTHFKEFGDSSLKYEVVYYISDPDYNAYMDTQQSINFAVKDGLERLGVGMAFPTRTIHLKD